MRHRVPADVLLLVTVLFWSFNFTAAKYALTHGFAPLAYSALRFGLGAVLFSGVTFGRERSLRIRRGDVALALGAAVLGIWLNQVSFTLRDPPDHCSHRRAHVRNASDLRGVLLPSRGP